MDYQRRVYHLPAELEDDLSAALMRAGALGCEVKELAQSGRLRLDAWFEDDATPSPFDLSAWPDVEAVEVENVEDRDWLADYRAQSQPFDIGRFRIDPRDETDAETSKPGAIVLHVPAENAFGTGSHESTRLMLGWLGELDLEGRRVLDVGTGSGILAFAALHRGARSVLGYDFDPPSVITARRNAGRNSCKPRLIAGTAACLRPTPSFDLLLVNVLPERILGDLARLVDCLEAGGLLISSGNLAERRDALLPRFLETGLELQDEKTDGEWLSFLFTKS